MRTSSYNIIVKVDNEAGRYALLNSYTHAFDIVNQNVYQYLKNQGENGSGFWRNKRKSSLNEDI